MQSKLLICLVTNIQQCSRMTDDSVPSFVGYGLGGLKGVKGLPDQLCDRVFYFNVDSDVSEVGDLLRLLILLSERDIN